MTVKQKISKSFVSDWHQAYKWIEVQFAVAAGAFATWAITNPEEFDQLLNLIPEDYKPIAGILVGLIPILLRIKK